MELRDRIGIVLQESGVDLDLTVREAIETYGAAYTRRRPTDELIDLVGADGEGRRADRDPVRRPAPPARPRARRRRRSRADLPRRAHHRLRPGRAPALVGADPPPARRGHDDPPDHPLHGGGPAARRQRRGDRGGADRRVRPAGRADRRRPRGRDPLPGPRRASRPPTCRCPPRRPRPWRTATSRSAPPRRRRPSPRCSRGRRERGLELEELKSTRATLEDVYLQLTGEGSG